jgi:hypothetical protein
MIVTDFVKNKILKSSQAFDQFSCMMYRLKAQILHFILVTIARQPNKYAPKICPEVDMSCNLITTFPIPGRLAT